MELRGLFFFVVSIAGIVLFPVVLLKAIATCMHLLERLRWRSTQYRTITASVASGTSGGRVMTGIVLRGELESDVDLVEGLDLGKVEAEVRTV